ncbi:hypothetical protein GCM10023238_08700 [Streptomyces heliomycini]
MPLVTGGRCGTADEDQTAGAAGDEPTAQQPAERAERTGHQVRAVGAKPWRQRAGQAGDRGEAAGETTTVAQRDLVLAVGRGHLP